MNKQEMYQQALTRAIEQAINGKNAVAEYTSRLAEMKAEQILKGSLGKDFACKELDCRGRLVAVGYEAKREYWNRDDYAFREETALIITLWFARDVTDMIEAKGVTDAEKRELKSVQRRYNYVKKGGCFDHYYCSGSIADSENKVAEAMKKTWSNLNSLKNEIKALTSATYYYSLEKVLADDFMKIGLSYDGQSILCRPL
jgi:hypothetical protein